MKFSEIPTPSYVIDEKKLISNLEILHSLEEKTGCRILLAQKAFSAFAFYPLIGNYLSGTTASGLFEARLSYEEMHKENHIFSPAYRECDMREIAEICDHIVFNSFAQLDRFYHYVRDLAVGIRINPEFSTQESAIYDPCAPHSRFGVKAEDFPAVLPDRVSGIHFHTLCEQNSDALVSTFAAVEEKFADALRSLEWINLGGGHHITRPDYDIDALVSLIKHIRDTYHLTVYLEPGEAVALNAGYLVTTVLDIVDNGMKIAICDASAECHMPDVIEMPYRPPLANSGKAGEKKYTYRISSASCLAGDITGDYSFDEPLSCGDRLVFSDMAIYSMVKNNTFNGMPLPSIAVMHADDECEIIKSFAYKDFKERLS